MPFKHDEQLVTSLSLLLSEEKITCLLFSGQYAIAKPRAFIVERVHQILYICLNPFLPHQIHLFLDLCTNIFQILVDITLSDAVWRVRVYVWT